MVRSGAEGVIKYERSRFLCAEPLPEGEYQVLERWRGRLYQLGLIGAYPDGVGYGNLSCRRDYSQFYPSAGPQFIITASQTGHLKQLAGEDYSRVLDFDIERMKVLSMGVKEASSETLTHAAIYSANPLITAVAHGHHKIVWRRMAEMGFPNTPEDLAYGTAEMAFAVGEIARHDPKGVLVMKGHLDGIVCFGPDLDYVVASLEELVKELTK
jgi:ribulose-5-phosphate 4-epimerase/fuculose-1-phosphate aldolase